MPERKADKDGNYMSVQNVKDILDMAQFLSSQVNEGDQMEDWVEDKISSVRQSLSDLVRFYSNGDKEKTMSNEDLLKKWGAFVIDAKQDSAEDGAEGYFADIPYYRETKEFAQSRELTNDPNIDPQAAKKTPPTPSEIPQDEQVKTLSRVKVEEESVDEVKETNKTAFTDWTFTGK